MSSRKSPRARDPAPGDLRKKTQIVVVGGGVGGLELARRLGLRFGRKRHDIVLVDKSHSHVWKPLLHEIAAGTLDANLDEVGYRAHCHRWGYRFFFGRCEGINRLKRQVLIAPLHDEDGRELIAAHSIRYDYLVLAMGGVCNVFGTSGARENCLFLDDRQQADRFRAKLLNHCLRVSRAVSEDPNSDARVRVAVIGGGATGVELSAELFNSAAGLRHYGLEVFDEGRLSITLVEAGSRLLPQLPKRLSRAAQDELEKLGVRVLTDRRVNRVDPNAVLLNSNEIIPADLIVWAAGVKGAPVLENLDGLELSSGGRVVVGPTLQSVQDDRILAIGDCCHLVPDGQAQPIPPRAQAAHQMAQTAYANIVRLGAGRELLNFRYRDHGSLVSLSRFSTLGSLMGNLIGSSLAVEGRLARFVYNSLYWSHLLAIHGWARGIANIMVGKINKMARPRLKVH